MSRPRGCSSDRQSSVACARQLSRQTRILSQNPTFDRRSELGNSLCLVLHLKMTRLLFLCLLLLLPASADISGIEGSADDPDDEDENSDYVSAVTSHPRVYNPPDSNKATGEDENGDGYLIIIVIAGVVLALSVAAVVTILIVRRKMQQQEQGIYTVPTEQDPKEKV